MKTFLAITVSFLAVLSGCNSVDREKGHETPSETRRITSGSFACPVGTEKLPLVDEHRSVDYQLCVYGNDRRVKLYIGNMATFSGRFAFFGQGSMRYTAWFDSSQIGMDKEYSAAVATGQSIPSMYVFTYTGPRDKILTELADISNLAPAL